MSVSQRRCGYPARRAKARVTGLSIERPRLQESLDFDALDEMGAMAGGWWAVLVGGAELGGVGWMGQDRVEVFQGPKPATALAHGRLMGGRLAARARHVRGTCAAGLRLHSCGLCSRRARYHNKFSMIPLCYQTARRPLRSPACSSLDCTVRSSRERGSPGAIAYVAPERRL